jgi:polysaccharide deacetylase family protein (PEP-CTERM system associated)
MNAKNAPSAVHALTVDVEEYFQVEALARTIAPREWPDLESRVASATSRVLDILASERVHATFFTLGWVARRHGALVRRIVAAGHELASHGEMHQMITQQSRDVFREDVRASKKALEDAAGVEVVGYRAPTFSVVECTRWALDELRDAGFRYDSSIYPIAHDRYGIPDASPVPHRIASGHGAGLIELPLTTVRVLGHNLPACGGGYLRLLPIAYNVWALRRVEREGRIAVVYFHPWEIDQQQPRFQLGRLRAMRAYGGMAAMESRVRRLVRSFAFAPAREVLVRMGLLAGDRPRAADGAHADAMARG